MRLMYDGIASDAQAIASHKPSMVAGYVDGKFAWTQAQWNLFPNAVKVRIAVKSSTNDGDVIDCEAGDASPAQAAAWVAMRKKAGYYRPTIYCNKASVKTVREATGKLALGVDYDIWVADWTGKAHQVTSAEFTPHAALPVTQYTSTANYDLSAVYDDAWPHRVKPAPVTPKPAPVVSTAPSTGIQDWFCCKKCACMVCNSKYPCPAGGEHDITGSWTLKISYVK